MELWKSIVINDLKMFIFSLQNINLSTLNCIIREYYEKKIKISKQKKLITYINTPKIQILCL